MSVGGATLAPGMVSPKALVGAADEALGRAKQRTSAWSWRLMVATVAPRGAATHLARLARHRVPGGPASK